MSIQAQLVLLAWLPLSLYFFSRFQPQTAIILSVIGGQLFLPERAAFALPLIPDYDKITAISYSLLLGIAVFDSQRLKTFKPSWMDLPMSIWCICPIFSSVTNNLGIYDGINAALGQIATWGCPYFLGRLYFSNLTGLRELSLGLIKGGLLYVPLCLYEVKMSPQLHRMVYGYIQHEFVQTIRSGGYRPMVFMKHGLVLSLIMMAVTLIAIWLWQAGALKKLWNVPVNWLVVILLGNFVLLKSTGAYGYLVYGLVILFIAQKFRSAFPLWLLIVGISLYLLLGMSGNFSTQQVAQVTHIAEQISGADRAQSLKFRLDNEQVLTDKARQKILFGWGGWGRNRVYEENWEGERVDTTVTDSLWVITFGQYGAVGLLALYSSFLLPVLSLIRWRYPTSYWFNPKVAPAAVLAVILILFLADCLVNAPVIPLFPLIDGGLAGLVWKGREQQGLIRDRALQPKLTGAPLRGQRAGWG
jgi:hypothetical protein